jgi:hypothetical protein
VQLCEVAILIGQELGHHCELSGAVDLERTATSVVVGVVVAVWIPSTARLVAYTLRTALITGTFIEAGLIAWVRRNVSSSRIGLPNVEFIAA